MDFGPLAIQPIDALSVINKAVMADPWQAQRARDTRNELVGGKIIAVHQIRLELLNQPPQTHPMECVRKNILFFSKRETENLAVQAVSNIAMVNLVFLIYHDNDLVPSIHQPQG
jgi:hypothetical protein